MSSVKMARRGSLPDLWGVPPEHGYEFEMDRLNLKVESLELEIRSLSQQLNNILKLMQKNQDGELSRNLQREITLPHFSGTVIEDAAEFLHELEQYLMFKKIPDCFQSKIIANALQDRAKVWFQATRYHIINFEDFCNRFRDEFLSEEVQDRAKNAWSSKKYVDGNVLNYFYTRVGEASKFQPPLSIYKVNKTIVSQYPKEIQYALAGVDLTDTACVVRALARIDEAQTNVYHSGLRNWRTEPTYNVSREPLQAQTLTRDRGSNRDNNYYKFNRPQHYDTERKFFNANNNNNRYSSAQRETNNARSNANVPISREPSNKRRENNISVMNTEEQIDNNIENICTLNLENEQTGNVSPTRP